MRLLLHGLLGFDEILEADDADEGVFLVDDGHELDLLEHEQTPEVAHKGVAVDNDRIWRHHLFHIGGRRLAGDVIGGDHAFELAIGGDDRKFAVPGLQAQLLPVANGVDGLQHIGIGWS